MNLKIAMLLGLFIALSTAAVAQFSGGSFTVTKSTIDNGGGTSTGGQYALVGTIGQPDAMASPVSGGLYQAAGGFWARVTDILFKNGFESN